MTRYEGLGRKRHWKDPDLWLKTRVNDGATHQGTEYRTGSGGVGKLIVKEKNQSFRIF